MSQRIERIESDTQQSVGIVTYNRDTREWERRTLTYPFGAKVVVEHAAQAIRFSDPATYAFLRSHADTIL